ncbi:MAG: HAD family hydrolase, partial [Bdellovibrionales bacterium]
LLGQAGLKDLLLDSTSADDASSSKPSPDIVQAAWKKTGCRKEEVLMIGDTPYDIEAAKRAGVRIIALTCGGWTRDELKDRGADAVYTDLADLLENLTTSPILSAAEIGSGPPQH